MCLVTTWDITHVIELNFKIYLIFNNLNLNHYPYKASGYSLKIQLPTTNYVRTHYCSLLLYSHVLQALEYGSS